LTHQPLGGRRLASRAVGRMFAASCMALLIAGCSSAPGTLTPLASQTVAAASATATATSAATYTATPAVTDTPTSTPSPNPTQKATPVPTPLPPLAVGLCKASQLRLVITLWVTDLTDSYAHVTATNKSSASCNMRGTSEARIADGHGNVIGDAGPSSAKVASSDPVYPLKPGGSINTIVTWGNWCHAAPVQKVFVAMVQPFGLGGFVSQPLGDAPIPTCYASKVKTQVSSEAWLP
jgi:hypothetical protein